MLHNLRQEMVKPDAAKGLAIGEILEADQKLRSTAEGRTYEGFTAFLNDGDQQSRFRAATRTIRGPQNPPFHRRRSGLVAVMR